jgi:hypothetical protein
MLGYTIIFGFVILCAWPWIMDGLRAVKIVSAEIDAGDGYFEVATISGTLNRQVKKSERISGQAIGRGTKIQIVGGDCKNLQDEVESEGGLINHIGRMVTKMKGKEITYPEAWKKCLADWLQAGADVDYILIEPEQSAWQRLVDLAREAEVNNWPGKLMPQRISNIANLDQPQIDYAERYRTYHFTLFHEPAMLWEEGNHPKGSHLAYNCRFRDNKSLNGAVLEDFASKFERLLALSQRE